MKLEDAKKSLKNKYSHEFKKLGELQSDFRAADEIRQNAYMHLQDLRRQLYEKVYPYDGLGRILNLRGNFPNLVC